MTEQPHDKEFAAFLAGESELADRYTELGREEPPAELDAQILAEARNAAKVHQLDFGPRGGWLKPVALAATVLLSLSLIMNIIVESPLRYEQIVTESIETGIRPDAEFAMEELRSAPEKIREMKTHELNKREKSSLPMASAARDQGMAVKEITVMARKLTAESDVDLEQPTQSGKSGEPVTDRTAALLIVAGYVAAIDSIRMDAIAPERVRKKMPASVAADLVATADEERQSGDISGDSPGDNPDSLLRDIERLHISGASAAAEALLDEFLLRYPDHPLSVKIRQQDY